MFLRFSRLLFLLCLVLLGTAQKLEKGKSKMCLDPRIYASQNILLSKGSLPTFFGKAQSINKTGLQLSLRFEDRLKETELAELREQGIVVQRSMQTIYIAFVPWTALVFIEAHPQLEYAESLSFPPTANRPLSKTAADIGASATHLNPFGSIGNGKIVADIDSGIDVLHPHFFFADGGRFEWMDVNENGTFEPNVDGIDLNEDGEISENERLQLAAGAEFEADSASTDTLRFEPRRDWLYLDRNKDGKRNAGISEGFSEEDLSYGEPIFVVEDVNRNDLLDHREILVQLGTSKVVKFITKSKSYERGINLISSTLDPDEEDFAHGTSVASILVGGQYGFHDRVGIAPGAEIVMYRAESDDNSYAFSGVMDAIENRYDLILHEWTESIVSPIDGSGNYEALMQMAYDAGIPSINPLGNLNTSAKHLQMKGEGENQLPFQIGDGFSEYTYDSFRASIFWLTSETPNFSLLDPDGKTYEIKNTLSPQQFGDLNLLATISTSPRGTRQFSLSVWTSNKKALSIGEWTLNVNNLETTFVGRIGDPFSGWAKGIRWTNPTRDKGSVVFPATADAAFGVAALDIKNSSGTLRAFSGRGPRIDGARVVDISAPDDPIGAFAATQSRIQSGFGRTWFSKFGGTSGAAPHVAGAHLLLQSIFPDLSLPDLEKKLRHSADTNGALGEFGVLPNTHLGAGKLNIYRAIFDTPIPKRNRRPTVLGTLSNRQIDSTLTTDPDGDLVQIRYDFEHDGTFETDWQEPGIMALPTTWKSDKTVHLQARDSWGNKNGILLSLTPRPPSIIAVHGGGICQFTSSPNPQIRWVWALVFLLLLARYKTRFRKPITR